MLYLNTAIPLPSASTDLEKEALICTFQSSSRWAHAKLRVCKTIGPNFDIARPSTAAEKKWCKNWKKVDRWRVCRSLKQETNFYTEAKSKALQRCRYTGIKGIKMVERAFKNDLYPRVFSKSGMLCPWTNDSDQGQKKKELYSMNDMEENPAQDVPEYYESTPIKTFQSIEELELELALQGWGLEQVFVRAVRAGYGWLIYPWNLAKSEGEKLAGLNDAPIGSNRSLSYYGGTETNGATGCSWSRLMEKCENDRNIEYEDSEFDSVLSTYSKLLKGMT